MPRQARRCGRFLALLDPSMLLETEVVIVGAGVSALSAAGLLTRRGLHCTLLEGQDWIGGRVQTVRRAGWQLPIELGAEFIHGQPAPTLVRAGSHLQLIEVPEQHALAGSPPRLLPEIWRNFEQVMRGARDEASDTSVHDYLEHHATSVQDCELARMIVEGYHAAPLNDVSARAVGDDAAAAPARTQYRSASGYDGLVSALEHGLSALRCRILLRTRVRRIDWSSGMVEVQADHLGTELTVKARCCLVTTSLGVLRASPPEGGIDFRPLPRSFERALPQLGMGQALRVVLRFQRLPWPASADGVDISFLHAPDQPFSVFWRQASEEQAQVTAWSGGPKAVELSRLDEDAVADAALRSFAVATETRLASCREQLLEAHCHDYNRDPFTRGAYSYVRPGGEHAAQLLATPCEGTLFFAGEALDLQFPGTVAGALGSGEHAARKVLTTWT